MTRICILLPYHWGHSRGGAEYQAHLLADHLNRQTKHQTVYVARHTPDETTGYGYAIHSFQGARCFEHLGWGRFVDSLSLYATLRAISPDVIIHMVASAYTGVAAAYARRNNCQLYWYLASDMELEAKPNVGINSPARLIDRALFYYGVRHADFIIAQTRNQANRLEQRFRRTADLVLGNFLPAPEHPPVKAEKLVICWIANLKQLKRPDLFLQLVGQFPPATGVHFRMAGKIAEAGIQPLIDRAASQFANFRYLGELSVEAVETELASAHLLINTSEFEGLPNVFIQAWLRETPVYSINVDPDGVMQREGIGRRTGSLEALVGALHEALDNPDMLRDMGRRARTFATRAYGMENVNTLVTLIEGNLPAG